MNLTQIRHSMQAMSEKLQPNWQETQNFLADTVDKVSHSTEDAIATGKNSLNQGFQRLTETGNHAMDKAQASLSETVQSADKITNTAGKALENAISASMSHWLDAHPLIAWLLTHPLITVGLFLILWLLLGGLFRAISRLTEHFWLNIFQSPLKLGKWLLGKISSPFINSFNSKVAKPSSQPHDKQKRLSEIVGRLEDLKQEQEELWQEMTTIIGVSSIPVSLEASNRTNQVAKLSDVNKMAESAN